MKKKNIVDFIDENIKVQVEKVKKEFESGKRKINEDAQYQSIITIKSEEEKDESEL